MPKGKPNMEFPSYVRVRSGMVRSVNVERGW